MSALAPPASRNAPCPCGSGKRFKACHGAAQGDVAQWLRRARSELEQRDLRAAEASLAQAQRLAPNDPVVLANLGTVCVRQRRLPEARDWLARGLAIAPDEPYILTLLAHIHQRLCSWNGLGELHAHIGRLLDAGSDAPADFNPFVLLSMPTTPRQQLEAARRFAHRLKLAPRVPAANVAPAEEERLRIGFVAADFRSHATVSLMLGLWERLDRRRLESFAYGILPRDTGPVGRRVEAAFEHFADVSAQSDERIAERIRADRIALLFDINGYTRSGRPGVFALRPSPVQISAIGFQGTLGTTWHDYIFTDRFSLPSHLQRFYTERPLHMPHMFYPSDTTRLPAGPPPSRAACGLPEQGFVFCCFNNAYKILPEVFAIWMRLLAAVPASVLWLLDTSPEAKANLRREAAAAGIDPERLVFAPRVAVGAHVARNAAADLFLDTYPYGAHTTANDALLAGLPVLTCAGQTLVSRIAGSQLHAIGLPELVTASFADYEALALELATRPALLQSLRARLATNRRTLPLFDMARYARDFEEAMLRLWAEHARLT